MPKDEERVEGEEGRRGIGEERGGEGGEVGRGGRRRAGAVARTSTCCAFCASRSPSESMASLSPALATVGSRLPKSAPPPCAMSTRSTYAPPARSVGVSSDEKK